MILTRIIGTEVLLKNPLDFNNLGYSGNVINMKMAPKNWDGDKLECFEKSQMTEIQNLSVALSDEEMLEYYGIENLDDLPEYDRMFFKVSCSRGRLIAKQNATHRLFKAMEGRDALPASLAYMTRFGHEKWMSEGTGPKAPKTLKITIEE
jgi:hypothetical protein